MNLTEKFLAFALLGAEWVMYLLIVLSIISVAIMIDRVLYFSKRKIDIDRLKLDLRKALGGASDDLKRKYAGHDSLEVAIALAGIAEINRGPDASAEAMLGVKSQKRGELERNLAFLGTVGNNAPFIGLFGTVLGIIRAFKDLADKEAGSQAVMAGISEALVATAIGLMVAIPAVVTFNYFQRRVRHSISNSDSIAHLLLTEMRAEEQK